MNEHPKLNDVVALLADVPAANVLHGQEGTVVDVLADDTVLIELADDNGCGYAITPVKTAKFLVLQYEQEVAWGGLKGIENSDCDCCSSQNGACRFCLFQFVS